MSSITKSFGIIQDNSLIKIAEISYDKEIGLRIEDLKSLIIEEEEEKAAAPDSAPVDEALDGLDFDFDLDEPTPDLVSEEEDSEESDFDLEEAAPSETQGERKKLEDVAREMKFENGTLSLNMHEMNITYKELDVPAKISKRKLNSELKKQFYDKETPGVSTLSYIQRNDGSYIGVSHEKNMELLERIISLNRKISKKRYHFSYIQPNEFVLLNALRYNYSIGVDDISAIIYISKEHTQVLLTKGYDFLNDLPLLNEGAKSKNIIKTVISRIMLERTQLGIGAIQNYFIAGEGLNEGMIEFVKNRDPDANVEFLIPARICEQTDCSDRFEDKTLAEYIIPIMLAVTAALPKEPSLIRSNFLPKQLREQQNFFSISIPGFIVLGLILITGLYSINSIFSLEARNRAVQLEKSQIESQISIQQSELDSIYAISDEIEDIEKTISRTKQVLNDKNQWHFIMEQIANNFRQRPLSWLTNMRLEQDGFRITGKSNHRLNIVALSELFPEAVIHHVIKEEIDDNVVWTFEISFHQPDPLETKRINYEREQARTNR